MACHTVFPIARPFVRRRWLFRRISDLHSLSLMYASFYRLQLRQRRLADIGELLCEFDIVGFNRTYIVIEIGLAIEIEGKLRVSYTGIDEKSIVKRSNLFEGLALDCSNSCYCVRRGHSANISSSGRLNIESRSELSS